MESSTAHSAYDSEAVETPTDLVAVDQPAFDQYSSVVVVDEPPIFEQIHDASISDVLDFEGFDDLTGYSSSEPLYPSPNTLIPEVDSWEGGDATESMHGVFSEPSESAPLDASTGFTSPGPWWAG